MSAFEPPGKGLALSCNPADPQGTPHAPAMAPTSATAATSATLPTAPTAPKAQPPLALALVGPTASGKSALALAAAARWPLEIISVDSAQVYQGMDIGTAKPSAAERAQVPHHLIDILPPTQAYSAAQFAADARRLIAEVQARGRHPLLVGGTMLYIKALVDGIDALPPADPALRAAIDARAAREGWPALHAELAQVDPATAARLAPLDAQRIQRALEVWHCSGQPLSALQGRRSTPGMALPLVSLEPRDRSWLHRRIAERFEAMLAAGLVDELRQLRAGGALHAALPAMRCVGYRQAWAALESGDHRGLRDQGIAATRQLAKRQLTWLRGMPRQVLACDAADVLEAGLAALGAHWGPPTATAPGATAAQPTAGA